MNKIHNLYILIALITGLTLAQNKERSNSQTPPRGFMFEAVTLPSETGTDCFISYRVNYNRLVFIKDGDKFISRFSVNVEAMDSASGKIFRENQNKELSVPNYELTNAPFLYVQGVIKLNLNSGKFKVLLSVFDINSGSEHTFSQTEINTNSEKKDLFISPLIVKNSLADKQDFTLINYEGNIPFTKDVYDLIIPVKDTSVSFLNAEIWNEDSLVFKGILKEAFLGSLHLQEKDEEIKLQVTDSPVITRNFIIRGFNENLKEGGVRIKITNGTALSGKNTFVKYVKWFDKPFSLQNTEFAVKLLKYIAAENDVDEILRTSDVKLYQALFQYWKKYDPTPKTEFNEVMEEYYQRADYAINNFSVIASKNGAETDRGKIYIKFGKPKEVQRTYSDSKDVKEIWNYDSPRRQFVFVDKTGIGNFVLNQSL